MKQRFISSVLSMSLIALSAFVPFGTPSSVFASDSPPAHAANLIKNGSFEDGLTNWDQFTDGDAIAVDSTAARTGKSELVFDHESDNWSSSWVGQTVKGLENGTYTLRAWVKSGGGQSYVRLIAGDTKVDIGASSDWTEITVPDVKVSSGSLGIGIESGSDKGHKAVIDDFELYRTDIGPNLVANNSFEDGLSNWDQYTDGDAIKVDAAASHSGSSELVFNHQSDNWSSAWVGQTIKGLENGTYTLKAWVKSGGGQSYVRLIAGDTKVDIGASDDWKLVTIPNVKVTGDSFGIGIESGADKGHIAAIDDFEFYKNSVGPNLLANAGFEDGITSNWGPSGMVDIDASSPHSGAKDALFQHTKEWSYSWMGYSVSDLEPAVYQLKAWVKGTGVHDRADMQIGGEYGGTEVRVDFQPTSEWKQITIADINVTKNAIQLGFDSEGSNNQSLQIDDVEFYRSGELDHSKVTVDDRSDLIAYSGSNWYPFNDLNDYGGTESYSRTKLASAQLTFKGTNVHWYGTKSADGGIADVYIDGVLDSSVDTFAAAKQFKQELYSKSGLANGSHTIKIVVSGTKNTASSGTRISLDQLVGDFEGIPLVPVDNFILNSSFEGGLTGWDVVGDANTVKTDSSGPHLGGKNAELGGKAAYSTGLGQTLTELTNGTYNLTAWVKSSGGQSAANMAVTVLDDSSGNPKRSIDIAATEQWKQISIPNIYVANGKLNVAFNTSGAAGTKLDIDDAELTFVDGTAIVPIDESKKGPNLVKNGSFENDAADWDKWTNENDDAITISTSGPHSGSKSLHLVKSSSYAVSEGQSFSGLTNGTYFLRAWVKSSGGQNKTVMVAEPGGGKGKELNIYQSNSWMQIMIQNIVVTDGTCNIKFYTEGNPDNWLSVDDVEFAMVKAPPKASLYEEDFNNVSAWSSVDHADLAAKAEDTITLVRVHGTNGAVSSMQSKVTYDINAEPYLSIKLLRAVPGASWKLAVNDGGKDILLTPNFKTETGLFRFDLKGITGWSGNKTFTIRFIVSAGADKFIDVDYIKSAPGLEVLLNHIGYLTNGPKEVVMQGTEKTPFSVIDAGGKAVFSGTMNPVAGDSFGTAYVKGDFGKFNKPGNYRVKIGKATSAPFAIGDGVYDAIYDANLAYLTKQRCGNTTLNWHGAPDHLDDGRIYVDGAPTDQWVDTSGGWHDAGDTRKWVGNVDFGLLALATAWENLTPANFNVRAEIRWGNEYFFKMQQVVAKSKDGKITGKGYWNDTAGDSPTGVPLWTDNIAKSGDERPINASLLGVFEHYNMIAAEAKISRLYKAIDPAYAARSLQSAIDAYTFSVTLGKRIPVKSNELGAAIDAAAEMYKTTGNAKYRDQAARFATQLLALQQKTPVDAKEKIYGFFHNSPTDPSATIPATDNWVLWSLNDLVETFPKVKAYKDALNSYFANYVKPLSERNAFGLVPVGLFYGSDPGGAHRIGASSYYMRYFNLSVTPTENSNENAVWWVGQNGGVLANGAGLARAAVILNNDAMLKVAQQQYNWVLGNNPYNRSQVTGFGYNNIPSYEVNIGQPPIPGGVVTGIGSPSNNDSPDPLDADDLYNTHEYWTPYQFQIVALETELMLANGNKAGKAPAVDKNIVDDFTDTYNWTTSGTTMDNLTDASGFVNRITSNVASGASIGKSGITVNVDQTPMLSIKVDQVSSGASWALKVNNGGKDIVLSSAKNGTGVFTFDLKSLTGWKGSRTFTIKIEVLGGKGKSIVVDRISKSNRK